MNVLDHNQGESDFSKWGKVCTTTNKSSNWLINPVIFPTVEAEQGMKYCSVRLLSGIYTEWSIISEHDTDDTKGPAFASVLYVLFNDKALLFVIAH